MSNSLWVLLIVSILAVLALAVVVYVARRKNLQYWVGSYYFPSETVAAVPSDQPIDVFLAICDHWEPQCYGAPFNQAMDRVHRWVHEYPKQFGKFRDFNGRPPQHSFFFPQDEYRPEYLDQLAQLCAEGYGDVDIHLHHSHDTAEALREKLESFRDTLFHRHGLLRRHPDTNEIVYGFIHGNWALCNSRPDGLWCGVDQELTILRETGCYADFTLPSAPNFCQTSTINSIYYARDIAGQRKSHDKGIRSRVGQSSPEDHLLMIQGPLSLNWRMRKKGIVPTIENGDLIAGRPPTWERFQEWLRVGVHVAGRPNWKFVKLHTHGCKDGNIDMLLGPEMKAFHAELAAQCQKNPLMRLHYVTSWEMARLVHKAEKGETATNLSKSTQFRLAKSTSPHAETSGTGRNEGSI